jgi:hypothetical protein
MKSFFLNILMLIVINSSFGQVVINEVMHKPQTSNSVIQGLRQKEYVEIYNTSCSSVDIGCWVIGSGHPLTGTTPYWVGAYQFPAGTIINPGQHLVVGGTLSDDGTPYDPSDIDFDVNEGNSCSAGAGGWLMPNGDGSVALYDDLGVVVDALYWSIFTSPNVLTDDDYSVSPCTPSTSCSSVGSLMSCRQIFQNYHARLSYGGLSTSFGNTFSRVPDGGAWQREIPPSITGNQCNNESCNSPSTFNLNTITSNPTCNTSNGSITFNPSPAGT